MRGLTALAVLLSGCGGKDAPTTPAPVLTTVVVSLSPATIQVGQSATASAAGLDQNGVAIGVGAVTWSSGTPLVASVSPGGVVSALTPGQAQIIATSGSKSGQQAVTVIPVPVATVTVTPPSATVVVGGTQQLTASTLNALGGALTGRVVTWSSSDSTKVSVSGAGLATGIAAGSATVTATSEGKSGSSAITVQSPPVATVTVTPGTATIGAGATQQLTATLRDAGGNVLSGKVVAWASSDPTRGTVTQTGLVTAVAVGSTTITATSEGKSGTSLITVTVAAQTCSAGTALQLNLGEIRTLTAAQVASLCLSGTASGSEYALIPFSRSATAAATVQVDITGTNTSTVLVPPLASQSAPAVQPDLQAAMTRARLRAAGESALRERERRELAPLLEQVRAARSRGVPLAPGPRALTATPVVGQVVTLNANGGQACSNANPKSARIAAISLHAVVMVETTAPTGGYTDAELAAFGTAFDTEVYNLDVTNFGAPTDIDGNGKVGIFFTSGVNVLTTDPTLGVIGGFFFSRDLFPVAQCAGSNFGEMFYMPVPDPNSTINASYKSKANLADDVPGTLAHEFQHLINGGRRLYVNAGAASSEEVWLNEGLSHIAEELLYYQQSGTAPRTNLNLGGVAPNQTQLNLFNTYAAGDFGLLISYVLAPAANSPYAQNGALETRGAIWQLLRYAADRKGGTESATWFGLVNSMTAGQANFTATFGDIVDLTHDWAIAQFTDDAGLGVAPIYTHPSWNFRSILPAFFQPQHHPLATVALTSGVPQSISLAGGGAAYVRFRVVANAFATVVSTSSGQPVPATVDFILVRSQ